MTRAYQWCAANIKWTVVTSVVISALLYSDDKWRFVTATLISSGKTLGTRVVWYIFIRPISRSCEGPSIWPMRSSTARKYVSLRPVATVSHMTHLSTMYAVIRLPLDGQVSTVTDRLYKLRSKIFLMPLMKTIRLWFLITSFPIIADISQFQSHYMFRPKQTTF